MSRIVVIVALLLGSAGPAIAQFAREGQGLRSSALFAACQDDPQKIDARKVFEIARAGDAYCLRLVKQTAEYIGLGLASLMMLTLPDRIVLTGGVLRSFDLMETKIREVITQHNVIIPAGKVDLQLADLGQRAGVFGAARAAQILHQETNR